MTRRKGDTSTFSLFGLEPDVDTAAGVADAENDSVEPKYVIDPSDELPAEIIKAHSHDKHRIVWRYVDICRPVRRQWVQDHNCSATFVDLFCGPGRVQDQDTGLFYFGSPLAAWDMSANPSRGQPQPFTRMFIADADYLLLDAAEQRLTRHGAPVERFFGEAEFTVDDVVAKLGAGFHFVLLDPYGIKQLPFSIIEKFARIRNLDLLVHVSAAGLRRNLGFNVQGTHNNFDRFAPGWQSVYDRARPDAENVRAIFDYWASKIAALGKDVLGTVAVSANKTPLYWLVLLSGNPLAQKFWDEITRTKKLRENEPLQLTFAA